MIKIRSAELETVCGVSSVFPEHEEPEIAFAGKSNVGKSSLVNALLERRRLARISSSPGKTQTINFYKMNGAFYLVDLPGYGYAKTSAAVKEQWGKMIERYLGRSRALKAVFLLVDIRHDPGENDLQMVQWITGAGFTPVIVATKADKIGRQQAAAQLQRIRKVLGIDDAAQVIAFSAVTKQGRDEILRRMQEFAGIPEEEEAFEGKKPPVSPAEPRKKARWPKEERHKAARKKRKGRSGI